MKAGSPHEESVQIIAAGSTVRRMRTHADSCGVYRVVTVDVPDGGTVELWVDVKVAPVLAAQLADGPVVLRPDMGDYRAFAEGELTGLQEGGIDCVRCGRDVEDSAVAVRRIGFGPDVDSKPLACHPRCGTSPWDAEQMQDLLAMPGADESTVVEVDGAGLSLEQLAGLACVECGAELGPDGGDLVGRVPGFGEVWQCLAGCGFDAMGGDL